jgi:cytochrome c551/c552
MKRVQTIALFIAIISYSVGCGSNTSEQTSSSTDSKTTSSKPQIADYDPNRGEGKFKEVLIEENLNQEMAKSGEKVYTMKCASCHKLTDERLVGPGWKGVTIRHTAAWIMNFTTNPDEMLDKDPKAQAQLEICLVRMPNQNLSDEETREVYEFMRMNDGVK